jgi:Mg2+ and Co2+ transporter CorA
MNERSYIFTIVATIFLPLSFFTGLMGIATALKTLTPKAYGDQLSHDVLNMEKGSHSP